MQRLKSEIENTLKDEIDILRELYKGPVDYKNLSLLSDNLSKIEDDLELNKPKSPIITKLQLLRRNVEYLQQKEPNIFDGFIPTTPNLFLDEADTILASKLGNIDSIKEFYKSAINQFNKEEIYPPITLIELVKLMLKKKIDSKSLTNYYLDKIGRLRKFRV